MWFQFIVGVIALLVIVLAVFAPKQFKVLLTLCYYNPIGIYQHFVPPPRKSVKDDIILITGGAMGMGAIMGERFGKLGAKIVLWDIQEKQLEETVDKLKEGGIQAWGYTCDVSDRNKIYEVAKRVKSEVGEVSMLINNAGIMCGRRLLETSDETIEKTMQVSLLINN
ncbi:Epidermal retinol dehydrogenase 2 [Oopsacas minuta]|uniref:Epidermal retinol dehydrogenase 2 n=1 Tax=Oopsacas minuta TaxID=111878 RepID=A0AAV7JLW1_9METZ|nr:Epidermal retinol dehydrogenase 2 [Oopsacas minuta]